MLYLPLKDSSLSDLWRVDNAGLSSIDLLANDARFSSKVEPTNKS